MLFGGPGNTLSVISPRVGPSCVMWASDALAGRPTGPHPFGLSTATWTWWWQEIAAGAAAVLLGMVLLVTARARRLRRA